MILVLLLLLLMIFCEVLLSGFLVLFVMALQDPGWTPNRPDGLPGGLPGSLKKTDVSGRLFGGCLLPHGLVYLILFLLLAFGFFWGF